MTNSPKKLLYRGDKKNTQLSHKTASAPVPRVHRTSPRALCIKHDFVALLADAALPLTTYVPISTKVQTTLATSSQQEYCVRPSLKKKTTRSVCVTANNNYTFTCVFVAYPLRSQANPIQSHTFPSKVFAATLDGEMGPYPVGTSGTLDGEMGPYPVGDGNLLGPSSRVFGTTGTLDGEMGPYPVGDSTTLLGTQYFGTTALTGYGNEALTIGSGRFNYGSTGPTVVSTTCSPMPKRRTPGVGRRAPAVGGGGGGHGGHNDEGGGYSAGSSGVASRDSFRRHSAHGRIVSSGI